MYRYRAVLVNSYTLQVTSTEVGRCAASRRNASRMTDRASRTGTDTLRLLEPKSNNLIALAKSPRAVWLSELSEPLSELSDGIR